MILEKIFYLFMFVLLILVLGENFISDFILIWKSIIYTSKILHHTRETNLIIKTIEKEHKFRTHFEFWYIKRVVIPMLFYIYIYPPKTQSFFNYIVEQILFDNKMW